MFSLPCKILVTGGAGFIGSHIIRKLVSEGADVVVLDDLSSGNLHNLPANRHITFVQGSILDTSIFQKIGKVDLVIHLASIVGMRLATSLKKIAYDTSVVGTKNVIALTGDAPVVLFSSSSVYGLEADRSETREKDEISVEKLLAYDGGEYGYACGKRHMEQLGLEVSKTGRKILVVRPFNVIGNRQVATYGMVVPTFVNHALNDRPLTVFGNGNQLRTFTCVTKFTEVLLQIIQQETLWKYGKNIINIGSNETVTINELAKIVIEETKSSSIIEHIPYASIFPGHQDVVHRVPDNAYLNTLMPSINWPSVRSIVQNIVESTTVASIIQS